MADADLLSLVRERLRSRLPKRTWSGLLDLLPELTRLADTA